MPLPATKQISDIKSKLFQPALTSHFLVEVNTSALGTEFSTFLNNNNVRYNQENLNLMCSEASLPGSQLGTHEINNDFTGVTERHAYRRLYDDRTDLTFYVDAVNYLPIRFFETWIKFIVDESTLAVPDVKPVGSVDSNYFYRVRYPEEYNKATVTITKFERTGKADNKNYTGTYTGNPLVYKFVNAYPIAMTSMPVSYDASNLLKCTVSMTYIRYILSKDDKVPASNQGPLNVPSTQTQNFNISPQQLAAINSQAFNPNANLGLDYGKYATTGGVPFNASAASGNAISIKDAYSGDLKLF